MILDSQIFKILKEGDGSRAHPIKRAWGKKTGLKYWGLDDEPYKLQYCLLEVFENLYFNLVSRIVDSDVGTMKLKSRGTDVPLLERSKSIISHSVSEQLIGDGINIVFKELNRYTQALIDFQGIDYQSFVILYNKIAINNAKDNDNRVIGSNFQDEPLFDVVKEDKEYEKQKEAKKQDKDRKPIDFEKLKEIKGEFDLTDWKDDTSMVKRDKNNYSLLQAYLHNAKDKADSETVKMICEGGAKASNKDLKGRNALWIVTEHTSKTEVFEALFEAGIECNFKPKEKGERDPLSNYLWHCTQNDRDANPDVVRMFFDHDFELDLIEAAFFK